MHFENEIEHKILVTYVIAKVSVHDCPLRFQTTFFLFFQQVQQILTVLVFCHRAGEFFQALV
ncbi:hypothetical protein CYK00_05840 [Neisseria sicca]|uniref:Uncharacterized protein n=1 Tax=Neisseria sicca TaxID=490 RepID=A0A2I1XC45_NEISI|nr:hypothetical protein CYK00_05840 [Neisseria sicca]